MKLTNQHTTCLSAAVMPLNMNHIYLKCSYATIAPRTLQTKAGHYIGHYQKCQLLSYKSTSNTTVCGRLLMVVMRLVLNLLNSEDNFYILQNLELLTNWLTFFWVITLRGTPTLQIFVLTRLAGASGHCSNTYFTVTCFHVFGFFAKCAAQTPQQPIFMNDSSKYAVWCKVHSFNYMFFSTFTYSSQNSLDYSQQSDRM